MIERVILTGGLVIALGIAFVPPLAELFLHLRDKWRSLR